MDEKLTSNDDVDEILKLALRNQTGSDDTLRQRLQASASELGISSAELAKAEEEFLAKQADEKEFEEFRYRQKKEFKRHLLSFVTMNACFIAFNLWTNNGIGWAIYPLFGWGIGIIGHAWRALNVGSDSFQDEYQAFQDRKAKKLEE